MLWQAIPSSGDYSSNERRIEGRLLQCSPGGCAIHHQSFGLNLLIVLLWPEIKGGIQLIAYLFQSTLSIFEFKWRQKKPWFYGFMRSQNKKKFETI